MAAEIIAVEESQINATSEVSYKIRAVTRYILSKSYSEIDEQGRNSGGCEYIGEFEAEAAAKRVRDALAK